MPTCTVTGRRFVHGFLRCDDKATIATSHRRFLPGYVNGLPTNISAYHRVGKVKRNTCGANDCV
jgi:hypothetical protein